MNIDTAITISEYQKRRNAVLRALGGAVGLVFAGEASGHAPFTPDASFHYLTGITDEPGAVVWFGPASPGPRASCSCSGRASRDGAVGRAATRSTHRSRSTEFSWILRTPRSPLARDRSSAARQSGVSPPLCAHRAGQPRPHPVPKGQERTVGVAVEDRTDLIASLRAAKSSAASAHRPGDPCHRSGLDALTAALAPGVSEDLERSFTAAILEAAALARLRPCRLGLAGTVLHYRANNASCATATLSSSTPAPASADTPPTSRTYPSRDLHAAAARGVQHRLRAQPRPCMIRPGDPRPGRHRGPHRHRAGGPR